MTGYKNEKCYASELNDCSKKISAEHYISRSLLNLLSTNGVINIYGLPWSSPEIGVNIPVNTFAPKILCKKHNEALAYLDAYATNFFKTINNIDLEFKTKKLYNSSYTFTGEKIELWLLKILCGLLYSGHVIDKNNMVLNEKPPLLWLKILFCNEKFPKDFGFYFIQKLPHNIESSATLAWSIMSSNNKIIGLIFGLKPISRFILAMEKPTIIEESLLRKWGYLPSEIRLTYKNTMKILKFSWGRESEESKITMPYKKS